MILSYDQIINYRENGNVVIEPFKIEQLNPNSYNLRLGNWFFEVKWNNDEPVFIGPTFHEDGAKVYIPTRGTLLGMTKEVFGGKVNIVPELRSRSTTRRCGITVCDDAGFGDIGYVNHWTVELTAHVNSGHPYLIVGQEFAQALFILSGDSEVQYTGQYSENDFPIGMVPKKYRDKIVKSITTVPITGEYGRN